MNCGRRHPGHTEAGSKPASGVHATRRWWIDLTMGGSTARVELPRLVVVRVGGVDVARLDELWSAAHLGIPADALVFDFVGDDGFRLTSGGGVGVDGRELSTGYVCVATRDLVWQPTPERPVFWRVRAVARVVALPRVVAA